MKKRFNTTGLCVPEQHYMVDISGRVAEAKAMVDSGDYFTISRPRQYGKTTMLSQLRRTLSGSYVVISTSFEGVGDRYFESEEKFCKDIFSKLSNDTRFIDGKLSKRLIDKQPNIFDFETLSFEISELVNEERRGIVLLIDEIDKSSNSKVFLQFLGLLRKKYLAQKDGVDLTFHSVILAGVHDVKNLKLAIRGKSDVLEGGTARFNSPWNIAVKFRIDMNFSVQDITGMLTEYKTDNALDFDTGEIAAEIHKLTNGYPYLVSDICQVVDEELGHDWTLRGVAAAVKIILNEKSPLFDDVIKNIENNPEIKTTVSAMLMSGENISFNPDAFEQGILYGIFVNKDGKLAFHNQLFEERLYSYLLEQQTVRQLARPLLSVELSQFTETGRLDMELVLRKFREFMRQEYRDRDGKFIEQNGRLLFLAYLRPIINGKGFSWVEPEMRDNKRMDIAVTYADEKFIVELKIWHGEEYVKKGLLQIADYLEIQGESQGYLVTFGLGRMDDREPEWIKAEDKDIFSVIV
jgi:hypothetical protein